MSLPSNHGHATPETDLPELRPMPAPKKRGTGRRRPYKTVPVTPKDQALWEALELESGTNELLQGILHHLRIMVTRTYEASDMALRTLREASVHSPFVEEAVDMSFITISKEVTNLSQMLLLSMTRTDVKKEYSSLMEKIRGELERREFKARMCANTARRGAERAQQDHKELYAWIDDVKTSYERRAELDKQNLEATYRRSHEQLNATFDTRVADAARLIAMGDIHYGSNRTLIL